MKGFKNTTRTQYSMGGDVGGYAKGGMAKGAAKISKVMGEFKKGELHSGSKDGPKVTKPAQAKAIAMSEARKAGMKAPMKKNEGGKVGKMPPLGESAKSANRMSKMTAAERLAMEARFGEKKRPSPADSAKSANRISAQEGAEARRFGVFKEGGKVRKYAEGGPVAPVKKKALPTYNASAAYQQFGADLKRMIDSGQLTLEQANALKAPAFEATRLRDVGQQQQAMQAALAAARERMAPPKTAKGTPPPVVAPTRQVIGYRSPPPGMSAADLANYDTRIYAQPEMPTPELPMGVGAAPMKVPTTRPDPNYIQQTIMTADGRIPNPAYTADVAMNQLRTSVPGSRYYTPQELEKIMGTIENTYSQPGVTGQQLSDAYRAASVAATTARHREQEAKNAAYYASQPPAPLSALPSDFVAKSIGPTPPPIDIVERGRPTPPPMQPPLVMEPPTRPPMQKIYEPRRPPMTPSDYVGLIDNRIGPGFGKPMQPTAPPMTPPSLQKLGQVLQRIQQKQRPGMDRVDPGFAIDRGGYGMTGMTTPGGPPPAGMAPVDPRNVTMMKKGGRTAMPKGKR